MIDMTSVVGFEWDGGNHRKNLDRNGVEQLEAEQIFLDPGLLVLRDDKHSGAETRMHAYGQTPGGRLLLVAFTPRKDGTVIRVISARDMSRRERHRYAQEA